MIRVTLKQVLDAWNSLTVIFAYRTTDQQAIYDRKKIRKQVVKHVEFFKERNLALVEEYGEPTGKRDDKGKLEYVVVPNSPKRNEFVAAIEKLLAVDVELSCKVIARSSLVGIALSPDDYEHLDPLLDAEPEEEPA